MIGGESMERNPFCRESEKDFKPESLFPAYSVIYMLEPV